MGKTKKELLSRLELLANSGIKASIKTKNTNGSIWFFTGSVEKVSAGVFYLFTNHTTRILIDTKKVLELSLLSPIWRCK